MERHCAVVLRNVCLLFTFVENGRLNQVTDFLPTFLFVFVDSVGVSCTKARLQPLFVKASCYTGAAASNTVLLADILLSIPFIQRGMEICW